MTHPSISPVNAVVLAGGLARRMGGGDKALVQVGGKPMLQRVLAVLAPQVSALAINANGDPARFAAYGLPVIADPISGFPGPLAGILAGMRWAGAKHPGARFVASAPADTPFFPADLVARLAQACGDDPRTIGLAASAAGTHPVFGLWPVSLADALESFLSSGQGGKILSFADQHGRRDVYFDEVVLQDGKPVDPFFNVNTPEDVARAETIAAALDEATL